MIGKGYACDRNILVVVAAGALLAGRAAPALAHEETGPGPETIWRAWNGDPLILLPLLLVGYLYLRGLKVLWRRAGTGRGVRWWQAAAGGAALASLFFALISPIDRLATVLFSAHMLQHVLLILVAAPLLVVSRPNIALLWGVPPAWRQRLGRWWQIARAPRYLWQGLTYPVTIWLLHTGAVWAWHIPVLYQGALQHDLIHLAEHASFLGTALLLWWSLAGAGVRRRLGYGTALLFIFTTMMQGVLLGVLMTVSSTVWYPAQATGSARWGLTPLQDQQLAGLIMWVPTGPIYLLAFLLLFAAWLRAAEREVARWEHGGTEPAAESSDG